MEPLWNLRPAAESDIPFILSSWLHGYRKASVTSGISNTIYFKSHEQLLKNLLGSANVVVACALDNPDQIFGYAVFECDTINLTAHWIYVKQPFRALGMGRHLMSEVRTSPHQVEWHTARTRPSSLLANSNYSPYRLWSYA